MGVGGISDGGLFTKTTHANKHSSGGEGLHGSKSLRALPGIVLRHQVSMVKGGVVEVGVGDEGREDQAVSSICRGGEGEGKGRE